MSNIYVESCTLHDDQYTTYHDLYEQSAGGSSDDTGLSSLASSSAAAESSGATLSSAPASSAPGHAGGFSYEVSSLASGGGGGAGVDQRFIIWRIVGGKRLELIEHSLTSRLHGNCKRIHFKSPLVANVHASKQRSPLGQHIVVLVATTSKLYRLLFPLNAAAPPAAASSAAADPPSIPSIFSDMSMFDLGGGSGNNNPNTFAINLTHVEHCDMHVTARGEALFAFTQPNHAICCVQMPPPPPPASSSLAYATHGQQQQQQQQAEASTLGVPSGQSASAVLKVELNQPNIVKRLWSGITRQALSSSTSSS